MLRARLCQGGLAIFGGKLFQDRAEIFPPIAGVARAGLHGARAEAGCGLQGRCAGSRELGCMARELKPAVEQRELRARAARPAAERCAVRPAGAWLASPRVEQRAEGCVRLPAVLEPYSRAVLAY
jgi:hypothetical protein